MSTPTVSGVTGWRPGELVAAADRLAAASASVDDEADAVRRHLGDAVDDAGGAWADMAEARRHEEAGRGEALADALAGAAAVLLAGASVVTHARESLLVAVGRARVAGFGVSDDGGVVAPARPDPPADVPPAERLGWYVAPEQVEAARLVEAHRATHEAEVRAALAAVVAADGALAAEVAALEVPRTTGSRVAAHAARTDLAGGDAVAALGPFGGAVVAARALNDTRSLVTSSRRLHHYAGLVRAGSPADDIERARLAFTQGAARNPVLRLVGRASMPLTIASGLHDTVTGGGYDGARGWATRGFAAAGVVGAGLAMTTAPALVVVGGTAVIAYGAWTAGNYVVDHWDQVEDAASAAGDWVADELADEAAAASEAVAWAGERLAEGAGGVLGELF